VIRPKKLPRDSNQRAHQIAQLLTGEAKLPAESAPMDATLLSQAMAEMGRKGGKIGGKKSLETMSKADRKKRARKAAQSRWKKAKK
jgi:hypothetical protein